ncbi:MAG: YesL family protein [Oscillospiraceae bacterium]|nr:YesL family protein [Oscillospiraceae bacterium]
MRRWYEPRKDTPGIAKDAPQKKGFARYFEILWREFFPLIKLNLLFIISCLPIVTIPAALTAMNRITVTMVRDRNYFMLSDYWDAFKRDFFRSLLAGVLVLVLVAVFSVSIWFYYMLGQAGSKFFMLFVGVSVALMIMVLGSAMYFFPMLAMVELPTGKLMRNSIIMFFTHFKRSLPAALISGAMVLGGIGLYPLSIIFIVFIMFSLASMSANFFLVKPIEVAVLGMDDTPSVNPAKERSQENLLSSAELGEFPQWEDEEGEN